MFNEAWLCAAVVFAEAVDGAVELLDAVEIWVAELVETTVVWAAVLTAELSVVWEWLAGACAGVVSGAGVWIAWLETPSKIPVVS